MSTIVEYILSLKDQMSSKIEGATTHVKSLESSMGGLKSVAEGVGIAIGGIALALKGIDFIKESIADAKLLVTAEAEVKAGLISTHEAAGMSFEAIDKVNEGLYHNSTFAKDQLMDMQSILVTFPGIAKNAYGPAAQTITDMATRMHQDLKDTAIQVGKALQDPVKGAMALHRVGVNLSDTQLASIKKLVGEGHKLKAQQLIMNELTNEFAGSAKAAYDADPLSAYDKKMGDIKDKVGELSLIVMKKLEPAFMAFADKLEKLVDWIGKNTNEIKEFIKAILIGVATFKTISIVTASYSALLEGLAASSAAAATGTEALATASTTALGPIGLIAAAVASLTILYDRLSSSIERADQEASGFNQDAYDSEKSQLERFKGTYGKKGEGRYKQFLGEDKERLTSYISETQKEYDKMKNNLDKHGFGGKLAEQFNKGLFKKGVELAAYKSQLKAVTDQTESLMPKKEGKVQGASKDATKTAGNTKATGQKTINIHIAYNAPLIKGFTISSINIKEGLGSLKEKVTAILESATHDSLIVADY